MRVELVEKQQRIQRNHRAIVVHVQRLRVVVPRGWCGNRNVDAEDGAATDREASVNAASVSHSVEGGVILNERIPWLCATGRLEGVQKYEVTAINTHLEDRARVIGATKQCRTVKCGARLDQGAIGIGAVDTAVGKGTKNAKVGTVDADLKNRAAVRTASTARQTIQSRAKLQERSIWAFAIATAVKGVQKTESAAAPLDSEDRAVVGIAPGTRRAVQRRT